MDFRNRKVVIITGAGATRSDARANTSDTGKPPLDKGFFADIPKVVRGRYHFVREYMMANYGIDPAESQHDSLENVMSVVYSDALTAHGTRKKGAEVALRHLLLLIPLRIAGATNNLRTSPEDGNLSGIVSGFLAQGCHPRNLALVTFNYDLHAEKVLHTINNTKSGAGIFSFPHCYQVPFRVTRPRGGDAFHMDSKDRGGVRILKLHGSLNWRSIYESQPSAQKMLAPTLRRTRITPRMQISHDMKIHRRKKPYHTYPLIIPPIVHKAGIVSNSLSPVWQRAHDALREATDVVIFGYSCPPQDIESANLISGGLHRNSSLERIAVIDPSSSVYRRYIDMTGLNKWWFYRDAQAFIEDAL